MSPHALRSGASSARHEPELLREDTDLRSLYVAILGPDAAAVDDTGRRDARVEAQVEQLITELGLEDVVERAKARAIEARPPIQHELPRAPALPLVASLPVGDVQRHAKTSIFEQRSTFGAMSEAPRRRRHAVGAHPVAVATGLLFVGVLAAIAFTWAGGPAEVRAEVPGMPSPPVALVPQPAPSAPVGALAGIAAAGARTEPQVLQRVRPVYPSGARTAGLTGEVELMVRVDRTGRATAAQAIGGRELFRGAAVDAVRQWRYRPAMLDGAPVASETRVVVSFGR